MEVLNNYGGITTIDAVFGSESVFIPPTVDYT